LKVDLKINNGEYTVYCEKATRIVIERHAGSSGEIRAVEIIEDTKIQRKVEKVEG